MPDIDPGNALVSIAGVAALVFIVVEAVKRLAGWDGATTDRFAPSLALVLGLVLGIVGVVTGLSAYTTHDVTIGAVTGFLGGATATHIYDVVTSLTPKPQQGA